MARMSWRKPFWCDTHATDTSFVRRFTSGASSFTVTAPPTAFAIRSSAPVDFASSE